MLVVLADDAACGPAAVGAHVAGEMDAVVVGPSYRSTLSRISVGNDPIQTSSCENKAEIVFFSNAHNTAIYKDD